MKLERINFNFDTYIQRKTPSFYDNVYNSSTQDLVHANRHKQDIDVIKKVVVVEDVPRYFEVQKSKLGKRISLKSIKQYPGFLMNFEGIDSLEQYINSRFGRSSRYKLRREIKRLESCFDITYKMHFGEITKEEFDLVFNALYEQLAIRYKEKGIVNEENLATKKPFYKLVYQMILDKKASIYVIYNNKVPIDICLNFHFENVVFQWFRTYDINYSKFNTGYTNLKKQIEWCIVNEIKQICFGKGDFYWKRRWCNTVYDYDYHIFYDSKSVSSIMKANMFLHQKKLKQFLREKNIIEKYHELRKKMDKRKSKDESKSGIKTTSVEFNENFNNLKSINYNNKEFSYLKRTIFEFLYEFTEKEKNINVYRISTSSNTFLIVGSENKQLLEA